MRPGRPSFTAGEKVDSIEAWTSPVGEWEGDLTDTFMETSEDGIGTHELTTPPVVASVDSMEEVGTGGYTLSLPKGDAFTLSTLQSNDPSLASML